MSNVPAYPKNPALHPPSAPHEFTDKAAIDRPTLTEDPEPAQINDLNLSPPSFGIKDLVDLAPIPVILIAAGVGYIIGRGRLGSFI